MSPFRFPEYHRLELSNNCQYLVIILEVIINDAMLLDLSRDDTLIMTTHTIHKVADLVLNEGKSLVIKNKMITSGGSIIREIEVLEQVSIAAVIINTLKTFTLADTRLTRHQKLCKKKVAA